MVKLTEYELERQANIARNRALLEQLDLKEAAVQLAAATRPKASTSQKAKPVQPQKKRIKREVEEVAPRRHSARLMREVVDPNESPAKKRARLAEAEKKRKVEEEERLAAEERTREAKRPRHHDLDLHAMLEEPSAEEVARLTSTLQATLSVPHPRRIGNPADHVFEGEADKDKVEVKRLREQLQKMKVVSRAKVTQNRIYSAAYHPEKSKDLIFFGDKHGQLGIWDAQAPSEEIADGDGEVTNADRDGGRTWTLQPHWPSTSKSSISAVKLDPIDAHSVYTTSYDCTVRSTSFVSGISREIYSSEDMLISSLDLLPGGHEMWLSDTSGGLTHLDLRVDKSKARRWELSEAKIGCVSINPVSPHTLLTASNDRTLKLWDARMLLKTPLVASTGAETPEFLSSNIDYFAMKEFLASKTGRACQRAAYEHGKSASSAYWDPRGRSIVSTSYDDRLRLWNVAPEALNTVGAINPFKPFCQINHNCQTGRWLSVLKAQWTANPDVYPHFTIGNMNHSLDILSCRGVLLASLSDNNLITAVQAVTCSHPSIVERAVSGNASGRCVLWAPK